MTTVNETQRKYIRTRLAEMLKQKRTEVSAKYGNNITFPAWDEIPNETSQQKEMRELNTQFAAAGIDVVIKSTQAMQFLITPGSKQREADRKTKNDLHTEKLRELQNLYDGLMDDIMLGNDADSLKSALEKLASFSVN